MNVLILAPKSWSWPSIKNLTPFNLTKSDANSACLAASSDNVKDLIIESIIALKSVSIEIVDVLSRFKPLSNGEGLI